MEMIPSIAVEILGTVRQGVFTPAKLPVGVQFEEEEFVIGSRPGEGPSVMLTDGTVSRRHAKVCLHAGGWRIKDLGSDNGLVLFGNLNNSGVPADFMGERVEDLAIGEPVTLALGAVVIRLTPAAR
jgi:pSer/pThr/pTyr-binding forkhead associated (FHA) protein